MKTLSELIAALRAGRLPLSEVLAALRSRGARPDAEHTAEVAALQRLADGNGMDAEAIATLIATLRSVQAPPVDADATQPVQRRQPEPPPAAAPSAVDSDATVVMPSAARRPPPPADDATVVRPGPSRAVPAGPPVADATIVKPMAAPPPRDDSDATVIRTSTVLPPRTPVPPPPPLPGSADMTQVRPSSAASPPRPSPTAMPDPQPTLTTSQATRTGATQSGTVSGTSSSSSWQRVAEAQGGDFVTVGSLLKGRFYLEKEIGRGGMGVVYMARDERKVEARDRDPYLAVKVLNDEFRRHPDSLIALQRESRRSQQLAHDNIVRVFDFDKDGSIVFMTMEYIDGSDLKGLIRDKAYNGLSLKEARPLIEGMCRGLHRAHTDGVVHSDFKPGNVMVTKAGIPKVFDFGIARAGKMGDAVGETTVFDAGSLGALTPAYASLEMIQGKEPENADDIYALGCVAFELLTGKHPFDKVSAEIAQREGRKPPPVPGLTKRQYRTLCAAVAFTRDQRLKSALDLIEGLRELSLRERAMPYLMVGVPALVVVGGSTIGLLNYRETARVDGLFGRFEAERADAYRDESEARAALAEIEADTRIRLVLARSELIERFLATRVAGYWNPDQGRYDYAGAQRVFTLSDELKLFTPTLTNLRAEVDRARADLLNTLDSTLTAQIDADQIFETGTENAPTTLARIKAIDPASGLLDNARLELKYDAAIGASLDGGRIDEAKQRLALANRFFAASERIKARATQLADLASTQVAEQQKEQEAARLKLEREQAITALAGLIDQPANSAGWRDLAAGAYRKAQESVGDDRDLAGQLETQAARLRGVLAAQVKETADLTAAIDLAGVGLDLFPGDPALAKARQGLLDQQNKLAQEATTKAQRIEQSKARIASLLARPLGTAVWLQDVRSALGDARSTIGAGSPDYAKLDAEVGAGIRKLARERIAGGALDDAERLAKAGQQIHAGDAGYAAILAEVQQARVAAQGKVAEAQAQKLAEARRTLADLLARPQLSAEWQGKVASAIDTVKADPSPEAKTLVDSLDQRIAGEVAKLVTPQTIPQARQALEFGLKRQPKSERLLAERARIEQLQRDSQARIDQENAEAEVKSRIESVKSAAAANDVQKALQSLARIKALQPDNAFIKVEGPNLVADAYLRQADDAVRKGNPARALDVLAQAQRSVPDRPEFKGLKARYELLAAIKAAGSQTPSQPTYDALKKQLDTVRAADPAALAKLETALAAAGQLKDRTLAAEIERIRPGTRPVPPPTPPPGPATVTEPPVTAIAPAAVTGPAASPAPTPAVTPKPAVVAAVPAPSAPAFIEGDAPFVATGPDPCNKPALIGTGKACFDALSGARRGPRLVIVPGASGGPAYGLTRSEVSVVNFNEFCAATATCAQKPVSDEESGNAPVTGVSLAQANAYAAWLTKASGGYVYRLPGDAEWSHAAKGGGSFRQADNSNCVPAGGQPGNGGPVSAKGRDPNPWGLVHMSGNVWEWVTAGGRTVVRGASFNDYWSDCTVDARRDDDGGAQTDVGFRVLRELK
jgi:predicted Ser/Thr protein kinase